MAMRHRFVETRTGIAVAGLALLLSGCVSFGGKAPVSMLTLSADAPVSAGSSKSGEPDDALVILIPQVPRKLDTNRVAVQIDAGNVAYVKDTVWSDKPAVLMQELLAETLAAKNGALVLSEVEASGKAGRTLSGQLVEFGIDAATSEAVATFDAVLLGKGKLVEKRRFEARSPVGEVTGSEAGSALNLAANRLAADVALWLQAN